MEKDNFWNDEMVAEFTTWSLTESPTYQSRYADIEQFKKLKQKPVANKDWEIVSLISINNERISFKNGKSIHNEYPIEKFIDYPCNSVSDGTYKIHSVRRISDGEVFTVGDLIYIPDNESMYKILSFELSKNTPDMMVEYRCSSRYNICYIKKAKPLLFITEDGKAIYNECDVIWMLGTEYWGVVQTSARKAHHFGGIYEQFKYFSTKEAAEEYILNNKPCLSLQEVVYGIDEAWVTNRIIDKLKQLVKAKSK